MGKGSRKVSNPEKGDFDEYRLNLHYIEVPVLFRYHYKSKFVFEAGPSFATLIASSEEDEFGPLPDARPFNRTEIGFITGLDYILSPHVVMNLRQNYSILPIREHQSGAVYLLNRGQYNSVIMFTLRYYLKEI